MNTKLPFKITACILLIIGIGHVVRLVMKVPVTVGDYAVPPGASMLGALIAFGMAGWIWRALK